LTSLLQPGRKPILTDGEEAKLADHLVTLSELGIGKSMRATRELASSILQHRKDGPNEQPPGQQEQIWMSKKSAGKDWYYSFLSRHSELSLRRPEKLAHSRAIMGNNTIVDNFFEVLQQTLTSANLLDKPNFIYNCDETGVSLDFRHQMVVGSKKAKNIWSVCSGNKTNITVLATVNADGEALPPCVIFQGKRENPALRETAPKDWQVYLTEKGWMTTEKFEAWMAEAFVPHIKQQREKFEMPQQTALLTLDGHVSHESLHTLEYAKANNIIILCLPAHATHILQPLDVSFFRSLKHNWDLMCEDFARDPRNQGTFVNKYSFCNVFSKAWAAATGKKDTITNGFKRCGFFPFVKKSLTDLTQGHNPAAVIHRSDEATQEAVSITRITICLHCLSLI
jgi:hypothetical protein